MCNMTCVLIQSDVCVCIRFLCVSFIDHVHCVYIQRAVQVGYVFLVVVFVLRCQQRSRDWLTERQLFSSGLHVCPLNAKVYNKCCNILGRDRPFTGRKKIA